MDTRGDSEKGRDREDEPDPHRSRGQSSPINADFLWDYSDLNTISNTPTVAPLDLARWDGLERDDANRNRIIRTTEQQQQQQSHQNQQQLQEKDSMGYQGSPLYLWDAHDIQHDDPRDQSAPLTIMAPTPFVYRSRDARMIDQGSRIMASSSSSVVKPAMVSFDAREVLAAMGGADPSSAGQAESMVHRKNAAEQGVEVFKTKSSSSSKGKERAPPVGNQTMTQTYSEPGASTTGMASTSSAALVVDGMEIHDLTPANAGMVKRMSPEERALVLLKRKLRNRESAKNSRIRRQDVIYELTEMVSLLRDQSEKIKAACELVAEENHRLKEELDWLRRKLEHSDIS